MHRIHRTSLLLLLAVPFALGGVPSHRALVVGYLTAGGRPSAEDSAAFSWVSHLEGFSAIMLDAGRVRLGSPGVDLLWIHAPDSAAWSRWVPLTVNLRAIGSFYRHGGKFLCTGFGAFVPHIAGIESEEPGVRPLAITNDWLFDEKGIQGYRGHPAFDGLFGGVFTWDTDIDNVAYRVGYFGTQYPRPGRVVGVEKSFISLDSDSRLMVEYSAGGGRGMTIGAYVWFSRPNAKALHLRRFIRNTLEYIATGRGLSAPSYWVRSENILRPMEVRSSPPAVRRSVWKDMPGSGLRILHDDGGNRFFDLAGRRTLLMGRERGGIDEIWVYPFRVAHGFRTGIVTGDSITWLDGLRPSVEITPESVTRTYRAGAGTLKEILFPSFRRGGAIVRYEWEKGSRLQGLLVSASADMRWMWPYDERALGDIWYGYDDPLHALHVKDPSGDFYCLIGGSMAPRRVLSGPYGGVTIAGGELHGDSAGARRLFHAALYDLRDSPSRSLDVAVVGTDGGKGSALRDFRALIQDPAGERALLAGHYMSLLDRMVTVDTPDSLFDAVWRWTIVGVDRFIARTPRLGTGLLAGFSGVDRGWDGGQKISGRPGYAWYFGRDSEWSGLAMDDYGDAENVRGQIEFLQNFQDLTGKIFHELSASGVAHYDAADATPLYVVLMAHYVRASGDTAFLRASWPHLKKAIDFLYSTDTDGDLLIENTGVGHGWVEGGRLWPVHTEFYLAGIWAEALGDASWMASLLGEQGLAGQYGRGAVAVRGKVESEFWNPATGFYNFGKLKDGTFNTEPTVLPAPVMTFGWLDDRHVLPVLREYAGDGFSADWGMRIVREESPLFDPAGYHYGSVWPLFSGWTALAQYEYGNSVQGFALITGTMEIARHWAAGFVQEVMNGETYAPAGVCPHQCWSETAILQPGIEGMIGWHPDAVVHRASLIPRFPIQWDRVRVRNLRAGRSVLDFSFERADHSLTYRCALKGGSALNIDLQPEIPAGTTISGISVNGKPIVPHRELRRGALAQPVRLSVSGTSEVRIEFRGGVGVIPPEAHPIPGDSSRGFRVLGAELNGNRYRIDLEGKSGATESLRIRAFDEGIVSVAGGTLLREEGNGVAVIAVPFDSSARRWSMKRIDIFLGEAVR